MTDGDKAIRKAADNIFETSQMLLLYFFVMCYFHLVQNLNSAVSHLEINEQNEIKQDIQDLQRTTCRHHLQDFWKILKRHYDKKFYFFFVLGGTITYPHAVLFSFLIF